MREFLRNGVKEQKHPFFAAQRLRLRHYNARHYSVRHYSVRHYGKRALMLAVAIAVPAMAMATDWSSPDWSRMGPGPAKLAHGETPASELMPFETAGESFPGSAFYYLELEPQPGPGIPSIQPNGAGSANDRAKLAVPIDSGPAARPFAAGGSGVDKARALRCMTQAIYYEAASESDAGQKAVAQVVLNRVAHSAWPNSVCAVVFQGSERRTGCQFTFTCDGSLARKPGTSSWARAERVAARALAGDVFDKIGLATHYHTHWANPYWAKTLDHIGSIGAHRFYRMRGSRGSKDAFGSHYAGQEKIPSGRAAHTHASGRPAAGASFAYDPANLMAAMPPLAGTAQSGAPSPRSASPAPPAAPPALAPAPSATLPAAIPYRDAARQNQANTSFAGEQLAPQSGNIRPEFRNSGQWINKPADFESQP